MSTVTAISFKPKATRKRLMKEILSDDFKKRKIFWKNIAENFLEKYCGKFSVRENFLWNIFHLTSLGIRLYVTDTPRRTAPRKLAQRLYTESTRFNIDKGASC
jgi:hypothetical protein